MKVIVFGAGHFGRLYVQQESSVEIIAFADNNAEAFVGKTHMGYRVILPSEIHNYDFDKIVICINDSRSVANGPLIMDEIFLQLISLGIDEHKIEASRVGFYNTRKVLDLKRLALELKNVNGSVAECGVMRGHFAGFINESFPDKKLYLFDTFWLGSKK